MIVFDANPPAPAGPPSGAGRQLHAQDSNRVFQAAGNQYIFEDIKSLPAAPAAVQNTLVRDTAAFTGRTEELALITAAVTRAAADSTAPIPIVAVEGMPGVGKTALATHAGHQLVDRFPDGQLFVDLHAHTANQSPVDPADALAALLAADGMKPDHIPAGLDGRAASWRARMAGKRVLLIMDDAAGHAQVQALLPGAAGCLVLITSRRRLAGLSARHAALTITLDTLPPDQSSELFARLAGRSFTGTEQHAVTELVRLCGHLPLAISLLAAKIRPEPLWTVADLVGELAATHDRFSHLRAEDIAVAAAFDVSYGKLPPGRRRLFRRLGLHPGTDIDAYAAAALDGITVAAARQHLDELYNDHLLAQPIRGRFRMHDLIADFARTQVDKEPRADRAACIRRLLDHYQSTAARADRHIAARPRQHPVGASTGPALAQPEQAVEWMRTEMANLLACAAYADTHDEPARLIGLAAALAAFLRRSGPWQPAIMLHRAAAAAAQRVGDRAARAGALHSLGIVLRRSGDYPGATQALQEALAIDDDLQDNLDRADVLTELGSLHRMTGRYQAATDTLRQALRLCEDIQDRHGQVAVLNNIAIVHWLTDDYPAATTASQQALTISSELGDRLGQAQALFQLGVVGRMTSNYPEATADLRRALSIYEELGHRLGQANARHNLGVILRMTSNYPAATVALQQGLDIYRELGDRLGQANALRHLGVVRRITGDHAAATAALREARGIYRQLGEDLGEAGVLLDLGVVQRLTGDLANASAALRQALAIYRRRRSRLGQAEVLNQAGTLLLRYGKKQQALRRHRLALRLAQDVHSPLEEARALDGVAQCLLQSQQSDDAADHLRRALRIYRQIGAPEATGTATQLAGLTRFARRRRG